MELIFILISYLSAVIISILVKNRNMIELVSIVVSIIALVMSFLIAFNVAFLGIYSPFPLFSVDALGAIVMLITAIVGLASTVYSVQYLRQETAKGIIGLTRVKQYFIFLNIFIATMFLTITANSPVFAWISIEATTLSTALLISFYNKPSSIEAAWKYLIINSVGLLLGFFGTLLYFTPVILSGGNGFMDWQLLAANAIHLNPLVAKVAFIFVFIGYGTKVGLAPMHTWLPDAHSKAPAPISALLSGVLLNIALVIVLRFKIITDIVVGKSFSQNLLIIFGLFSIIIASLIIFNQKNYKRLLAYSSIENMGIIALGFGFGGLGIFAGVLHMIYHAFIKSALFLSAGTIFLKYSTTKIAKIRGALIALPVTSLLFLLGFFIITGTPPFGIFLTKILILSAGIKTYPIASIIAIIFMIILFIGFFNHATAMFFGEKPDDVQAGESSIWLIITPLILIAIVIVLSFYIPSFLNILINDVIKHY